MKSRSALLSLAAIIFSNLAFSQNDAEGILAKMDETVFSIEDKTVNMRMVMLNQKSGKEKEKEAILMQKGQDKKLFRYTAPESDVGISTLALPNEEIYVYLPMFKKPKKITNLAESGIFNNSDFSINDMANQTYSEKYMPRKLDDEEGNFVLYLTPKDEKPEWNHLVVYIDKQHFYPVRFDFYNQKNEVEKQALYQYTQVGGHWVAEQVSMEDLKKDHKTTLYMSDIKLNSGLADDLFTLDNLAPPE